MTAAIDIGSNSIRIAMSDGTRRSAITKLADGLEVTGKLSPGGVKASLAVIKEYAEMGGTGSVAFATEAVRAAADGEQFVALVKRETGLDVTVLSPETEARMALFGATKPPGAVTVCDLGGGSLEVISSPDGVEPDYVKSLPLGVVVLKNRYAGSPPRRAFRRATDEAFSLVSAYGEVPKRPIVLTGGSITSIAAGILDLNYYDASKVNDCRITAAELDGFMPVLMSPKLSVLRPVLAKRADTVAYGGIILRALVGYLGATEFTVSDSGNLEAVLKGFTF